MQRRQFLASTAAGGLGVTTAFQAVSSSTGPDDKVLFQGAKLTPPEKGLITVAFAISKGTTNIDWVGPEAVFEVWHFDSLLKRPVPRFKLFTVGETLQPVDKLIPDYTFQTAPPARIVVVPAQRGSAALLDWLRAVQGTADVTMSVCVGARHLAKAGLLDAKAATSHHGFIDQLSREFPKVNWVRNVRFVEGARVSTAGGLTAGIDLALRVVDRYFGRSEAQKVADHLEYQSKGWMV
jgi:transcriptional regulator GlxA family with amidase domain